MAYIWKEIIDGSDFWLSDGCYCNCRSILVAENFAYIHGSVFFRTTVIPEGISSTCATNDVLRFRKDEASDDCKILWDANWGLPLPNAKYVRVERGGHRA
jgi:hypothetical protein